ncbi:hypothetical protein TVAG_379420 [Trichomonas vaginalis G3]|uniref:VPS9 domain-containing protein n=1 Tax=Trichomonas vaginalis (strain ATCC PRA-98 / G3) TaxID=412133 RepID=A2E7G7_TRIV3|nr:hypothetical protein TVAGG3_0339480 [Trichomonas vaginalis G3]EAY11360.1 hypothetical protein TVAG_379420 [Trichomonas vaginalis G3]KAI5530525.1 hypothetical protein TVAGG3_0339480 [Trichomonas vaginalis G3]|eukprot:XP_001323583.1 hypothetical protein [Trichomonas vaginalis G3]
MKLLELDCHPLMEAFRKRAADMQPEESVLYHLLLPPEYNIPADMMNPLLYLFLEKTSEPGVLTQYDNQNCVLKVQNSHLIPVSGFDHNEKFQILQTTPCTTSAGFGFDMHELGSNPFMPSPIPPLCSEIESGYKNPEKALEFLRVRIRSDKLKPLLDDIENLAHKSTINAKNCQSIVQNLQIYMDKICDAVFEVRPFHYIPTLFKMKTNFIIFYAVVNLFHTKLLNAYHELMKADDSMAEEAVQYQSPSKARPELIDKAGDYIRNLHNSPNIAESISSVTKFFESVVNALPDKNAAADDILPAVCDGISHGRSLSSYIVSTFTYLSEIWPQEGLSERITYILVTCSIAASHFANGVDEYDENNNKKVLVRNERDETIEFIENYLDSI